MNDFDFNPIDNNTTDNCFNDSQEQLGDVLDVSSNSDAELGSAIFSPYVIDHTNPFSDKYIDSTNPFSSDYIDSTNPYSTQHIDSTNPFSIDFIDEGNPYL